MMTLVLHSSRSKRFTVGKRQFYLQLLKFTNGCFISVSEGEKAKLGAITLALKRAGIVNSSIVLPGRYEGIAGSLLAQMTTNIIEGMAIVSLYTEAEIDGRAVKTMLSEVKSLLQ